MARPRHPSKEIEAALRHAEGLGWRVVPGGAHAWGAIYCPEASREGHRFSVYSTPRDPEAHARYLMRMIGRCPHRHHQEGEGGVDVRHDEGP